MKKIKSFTYLDNYKMYSISSQIFEGLTEYVISSKTEKEEEKNQQEGQKNSGHVMADIITNSSAQTEKKFLHDYAYTLFEDALEKEGKILEIDAESVHNAISSIDDFSFVKIRGRIIFNDAKIIENTLNEYNEFGYWLGFISNYYQRKEEFDKLLEIPKAMSRTNHNQNSKPKSLPPVNYRAEIKKLVDFGALQQNEEFLKGMSYILKYGFNGGFEVQVPFTDILGGYHYLFSSIIDREFLKEAESNIITKYSRETEKEFVIFGIPTQTSPIKERLAAYGKEALDESGVILMKEVLMEMVNKFGGVEGTFTGKLPYEYLIDPIAIYREL